MRCGCWRAGRKAGLNQGIFRKTVTVLATNHRPHPPMPISFSFGKIQFDVSTGRAGRGVTRDPEAPFLVAVLADFTGRASRGIIEPSAVRRMVHLDCDNFDQVMAGLGGTLPLSAPRGAC